MERAAITKYFNLLNREESKTFVLVKKDNSIIWKHCYFASQNLGGWADDLWEYAPLFG